MQERRRKIIRIRSRPRARRIGEDEEEEDLGSRTECPNQLKTLKVRNALNALNTVTPHHTPQKPEPGSRGGAEGL